MAENQQLWLHLTRLGTKTNWLRYGYEFHWVKIISLEVNYETTWHILLFPIRLLLIINMMGNLRSKLVLSFLWGLFLKRIRKIIFNRTKVEFELAKKRKWCFRWKISKWNNGKRERQQLETCHNVNRNNGNKLWTTN